MHRAIALTLALSALGVGLAHADPTLKVQQQYVQPVFPPGPPPCIQCGVQLRPSLDSQFTVNPQQLNAPVVSQHSSAMIRR
jgi:hypothetical protein